MGKIILDTNAYSAYLSGDKNVLSSLEEADAVFMSVVVLGELFAGFYGGTQFKRNKTYLDAFLEKETVSVVPVSLETAEIFGSIKRKLREAGTPIPINDVWLAAHAFETGAKLVTFDSHFKAVQGLRIW
jgi:tRNA(fMet)-specific endonuclease VapC